MATLSLTGYNTGERGIQVAYNMTKLVTPDANITAAELTIPIEADIFAVGNILTIGEEDVTVTIRDSAGDSPYEPTITRASNSTTAAIHAHEQIVRLRTGTTLLTFDFDGSTWFFGVMITSETEALFRVSIEGVYLGMYRLTPYQLSDFIPFPKFIPASGQTLLIEAWVGAERATCTATCYVSAV